MRTPSHRHSWRRGATLLAAIFSTRLLVSAIEARVVIIYGSATRNTTAPSEDQGLAGWDWKPSLAITRPREVSRRQQRRHSAALFDQRGLYEGPTANGPWTYDDATQVDPGFSEVSCISARLGWIEGIVPDVAAPEPGTLLMLISAAFSLAVFGRFARRRK